jgi:hypothetical protein
MISYLFESTICLFVFLAIYHLMFEGEKYHRFNRWYLLGTMLTSLSLPLISVSTPAAVPLQTLTLPEMTIASVGSQADDSPMTSYFILVTYLGGLSLFGFRFINNLTGILRKTRMYPTLRQETTTIVFVPDSVVPHSFLSYIFISERDFGDPDSPQLLAHETAHVQQGHSFDILLTEILRVIFWFNPLFLLYKRAMQLNHEFLADAAVLKSHADIRIYQELLLLAASATGGSTITSNLNFLITKKRFIMMTKKKNHLRCISKTLVLLPVIALLFISFSTEASAQSKTKGDDTVHTQVDKQPEYPGGITAFYEYFSNNLAIQDDDRTPDLIVAGFVVEKNGSISSVQIKKGTDNIRLKESIVKVLTNSPKWSPGTQNKVPVRVEYTLPIRLAPPPPPVIGR